MFGMYGFKEVDASGLQQMQGANEIEVIDVRTEVEYAQGTIQGARHLPLHMLPLVADQIDNAKPVVFICRSGARSAQACAFLVSKGHENVFNLRGGIMSWAQAGLALAAA